MDTAVPRRQPTVRQIDRELDLVAGAIRMVASGEATTVRLAGLRFGEHLLAQAVLDGRMVGVRVSALWTSTDEGPVGLVVEAGDGASS
jgi:hypothetical protein